MKFVIQRVTNAKCEVDNQITGQIEQGFCVFIGVAEGDNEQIADKMIRKLLGMRIFADADGKTNLALQDVNGGLLLISQFTLYANCRKGNRPSFTEAGNPELANHLYEYIIQKRISPISLFLNRKKALLIFQNGSSRIKANIFWRFILIHICLTILNRNLIR